MTPVELVRDLPRQREDVVVRRARAVDVPGIAALVDEWAAEALLLPRSAAEIARAVDDYVVATDARGRVLACAALREYSPSLAELTSVAVSRAAHGRGLGRLVVGAVEALATVRGHATMFAHTLQPEFFAALGYEAADRAQYPEKRARAHTLCVRRALPATVAAPARFAAAA
jgi:amino-acid N-acetyltransferase